jgi:hypothetical protein
MDDASKIGLREAIEVIRELLREHLKRTGKIPETVVAIGGTALAILRIRERSDDLDLYLSEVDDDAVESTVKRYRSMYGPQFKIDVTPANTLWGPFAVKDIEESPVTDNIEIDGQLVQIRVLSPETMYLIKVAADRPKDRDDVPIIGKHCNYMALITRAKRLLPWYADRSSFAEYVERLVRSMGRDFERDFSQIESDLGLSDAVLARAHQIRSGMELQFWQLLRSVLNQNPELIQPDPKDPRKLTFDRNVLRQELRDLEIKDPLRFANVMAEALKRADLKRYVEWLKLVQRRGPSDNDGDGDGSGGGMAGGPR